LLLVKNQQRSLQLSLFNKIKKDELSTYAHVEANFQITTPRDDGYIGLYAGCCSINTVFITQ